MLSNFLPGLREIRAPLTAGYIWLITTWLLFHSSIPTEQEARGGPLEPFFDLGGVVSSFGVTLVLSVFAYLIGSLSEGVFRIPIEAGAKFFGGGPSSQLSWKGVKSLELLVQDRVRGIVGQLADDQLSLQQLPEYEEPSLRIEEGFDMLNRAGYVFQGVISSSDYIGDILSLSRPGRLLLTLRRKRFRRMIHSDHPRPTWVKGDALGVTEAGAEDALRENSKALQTEQDNMRLFISRNGLDWNIRYAKLPDELRHLTNYEPKQIEHSQSQRKQEIIQELLAFHLELEISNQVTQEMPLVGTRLLGKETDLFHEFDRQRGESSFRLVIIPPLLVLAMVLTIRVHSAFFILVGTLPLFYWQGVRYRQEASDVLIDSLVVGRVEAPAIEKLQRAAARAIALRKRQESGTTSRSSKSVDSMPISPRRPRGPQTVSPDAAET